MWSSMRVEMIIQASTRPMVCAMAGREYIHSLQLNPAPDVHRPFVRLLTSVEVKYLSRLRAISTEWGRKKTWWNLLLLAYAKKDLVTDGYVLVFVILSLNRWAEQMFPSIDLHIHISPICYVGSNFYLSGHLWDFCILEPRFFFGSELFKL